MLMIGNDCLVETAARMHVDIGVQEIEELWNEPFYDQWHF